MFDVVPGKGPSPTALMFIGESPGTVEVRTGNPLDPSAPTGARFDELLYGISLQRELIYITNLYKSHLPSKKSPTPEQITDHAPLLWCELDEVKPHYLITLGAVSTRYFLGDVHMDTVHGIPHSVSFPHDESQTAIVLPIYNPAAGLHNPETGALVHYDFKQLDLLLGGKIDPHPLLDKHSTTYYLEVVDPTRLEHLLRRSEEWSLDTEGTPEAPLSIQISESPGSGFFISALEDEQWPGYCNTRLQILRRELPHKFITLQNALHDLSVLEALGIHLERYQDTMVMAYNLVLEPQGLKPLAFRHAGMKMQDFTDVVAPYQKEKELQWLESIAALDWEKPEKIPVLRPDGTIHMKQPQSMSQLIKRAQGDRVKNPKVNLKSRWRSWEATVKDPVIDKVGDFPQATLSDVDRETAIRYAIRDADATERIKRALIPRIQAMGLEQILSLDTAVLPMINRMMKVGMKVQTDLLHSLKEDFDSEMEQIQLKVQKLSDGVVVNPGSNQQIMKFLFTKLRLKPIKKTAGGQPSVSTEVMETLKMAHPVCELRIRYKELEKLRGTYAVGINKWVGNDERLHATLRATRVATGRLSASDPNVLSIPTRTKLGKKIRQGFVAPDGFKIGAFDYGQLELRVLAHDSEDPTMVKVFQDGRDLHDETERKIFGTSGPNRIPAKTVNFAICYGVTAKGLQWSLTKEGLEYNEMECGNIISEWLDIYSGVREYMAVKRAEARQYGYVRDMHGRIRYLPNAKSFNPHLRGEAEREAGNHPIQGGAAGIVKRAMVDLWRALRQLWKEGVRVECLLQVHDEMLLECQEKKTEVVGMLTQVIMEDAMELRVPLVCEGKWGNNWGELK